MKLEMRVDGSTASKVRGVRRSNMEVHLSEVWSERPAGTTQDLSTNQPHRLRTETLFTNTNSFVVPHLPPVLGPKEPLPPRTPTIVSRHRAAALQPFCLPVGKGNLRRWGSQRGAPSAEPHNETGNMDNKVMQEIKIFPKTH